VSKGEGGADGRVPCHGKFSSGGEDPHADIGVVVLGRKEDSEKFISFAIRCMVAASRPVASANTASWFPLKCSLVKTS
jgi:hypothetical protein